MKYAFLKLGQPHFGSISKRIEIARDHANSNKNMVPTAFRCKSVSFTSCLVCILISQKRKPAIPFTKHGEIMAEKFGISS